MSSVHMKSIALRLARSKGITKNSSFILSRAAAAALSGRDSVLVSLSSRRSMSIITMPEQKQKVLKEQGIIDDMCLTQFNTLHEMQVNACIAFDNNELFGTFVPAGDGGEYEWMTYEEYAKKVETCRGVLKEMGVSQYDKIGIISNNRWEWATIAAAAYSLNASLVPMYEAQLPTDWTYILNDSQCMALFVANQEIYDKVQQSVLKSTPSVQGVMCLDAPEGEPHAFATAMAKHEGSDTAGSIIKPTEEDLANLIYTSGTTGKPKGVELTHLNFTSNVKAAVRSMVEDPTDFCRQDDRSLAFLPWAHSYGQTCELWSGMAHGGSMGICRGVPHILEDLQYTQPTVLFAVPTLYKRIYDGVHNLMENANPIRKKLMQEALRLGRENVEVELGHRAPLGPVDSLKFKALDSIVLSKIRARFGGNLRHGFVAGAACPKEVLEFMDSLGIPICEGYGLTETSPIITINTPENRKVGFVGKPLGGVTVHIIGEDGKPVAEGEEGEICCVGPNVMRGYYRNQEATDEVISLAPDGKSRMFHTGDLGRQDKDGFVKVTGRKKEQYKMENGKYVVPTPIEEAIGMSRFISQVVLHGDNRPYNVVLIVPEWTAIRQELGLKEDVSEEDLANDERVKQLLDDEIHDACVYMKKFEVPQKWAIVAPFTAANSMLTPKMSIRRHKVVEVYHDLIGHLYGDDSVRLPKVPHPIHAHSENNKEAA